jgi:hypothetical protein
MYGVALLIMTVSAVGSAMAANTARGLGVISMLAIWRFILGIGVGGATKFDDSLLFIGLCRTIALCLTVISCVRRLPNCRRVHFGIRKSVKTRGNGQRCFRHAGLGCLDGIPCVPRFIGNVQVHDHL